MRRNAWSLVLLLGMMEHGHAQLTSAQAPPNPAASALTSQTTSAKTPVTFSADMLAFPVDVSLFAEGKPVPPGTYRVELYLNDAWKGKFDVRFERLLPNDHVAQACFDQALIDVLDVDPQYLHPDAAARLAAGQAVCGDVGQVVQSASHRFDIGTQSLTVSTPQIVLMRRARGYVDPSRWDAGIPAATLDYRYNGWYSRQSGRTQTSHYLGLRGGVNLGNWRLRHRATVSRRGGTGTQYRSDTLFVERALIDWRSQLTAGDIVTGGRVMDSLRVRGVSLASNESMRPDSLRGFAPVIRGIAQSNARVTVHQRGSQIFEMTVPPGPFIIDDLYPNGSGGDLVVTITEADGSQRRFSMAYASLPELLRPGVTRYSVAVGEYRRRGSSHSPKLLTATLSHGINNTVTAYGGFIAAQGYRALTAGAGLNLPIGAVSLDATWTHLFVPGQVQTQGQGLTQWQDQRLRGTGLRLAYTKLFTQTDTDVNVAVAHYASPKFYEPAAAFDRIHQARRGEAATQRESRRSQLSVSLSQSLPGTLGSLAVSGTIQNYWQTHRRDMQYHVSYGRNFGNVSASLSATRSRNTVIGRWDNQVMLTLSIPVGSGARQTYLHSSFARRPNGKSAQTSVSGMLGAAENSTSYSLYGTVDRQRAATTTSNSGASLAWSTTIARMSASVSASSRGSRQVGLSALGGVVAFADGLVFSPALGDTVGVVQAKNAQGVRIRGAAGVRLDSRGHALVANLQPYHENTVDLDTRGLSLDVEVLSGGQKVAPTEGAVVLLRFETRIGHSILMTGKRQDGSFLPFAAGVFDAKGNNVGYVGQVGQALVRVGAPQGELTVRWGKQDDQRCRAAYDLETSGKAAAGDEGAFRRLEVTCL